MKSAGALLLFLGLGSIVLYFLKMDFRFLAWIDMWGAEIGWVIRAAVIVAGAALLAADKFMGGEKPRPVSTPEAPVVSQYATQGDIQPGSFGESQDGGQGEDQYGPRGQ